MEIIKIGKLNPKALEKDMEVQFIEHVIDMANNYRNNFACLKRLDYLLKFINKNNQTILQKYIENLETEFKKLTTKEFLIINDSNISEILKEKKTLSKYPNLVKHILNYSLQLLNITGEISNLDEKYKVTQNYYMRSFLIPNYYYLQVLIQTIGREKAIGLFKEYISKFLDDNKTTTETEFTTLEDRFERIKKNVNNPSDWVMIYGMISKGKMFFRNENCLWIDVLKDLPDSEIKYCICCYGDYQTARTYRNEHIVLTMEHTIAEGDQYCSRVLHDTRIDWNLKHPPKEFWDNIKI
ncbi:MAG: hypothetical protein FK733_14795 [Asgard group archaeon]|nr:hypothetical protein [Asgard group archaeon]